MPIERVLTRCPEHHCYQCENGKHPHSMKYDRGDVSLMDIPSNRVSLILENNSDRIFRFGEILARIDAHQGARGTVLFTGISRRSGALGIKRRVGAEVALDRQQIGRVRDRRRNRRHRQAQPVLQDPDETLRSGRRWFTRDHRDRIVGTLSCTISAANTGIWIDINLTFPETRNRPGRTSGQTFRVFAMKTYCRRQHMLDCAPVWLERAGYVYTMPEQSGLAVNSVAGERTVATANAEVHVHYQEVVCINDAGRNFLCSCRYHPLVGWRFRRSVIC